ncbi:MAG TPA: phasin family protein [Rhodanobacter sp.]
MSTNSNAPFALFKANQDFHLRISKLLQENAQLWQELGSRTFSADVAASKADLEQLSGNKDWQTLAAQSGEVFKRQWQQRLSDVEALTQATASSQATLFAGLREALQAWQEESVGAMGSAGDTTQFTTAFNNLLKPWGQPFATEAAPAKKESARGK